MKYEEYNKLKKNINEQDFNRDYSLINLILKLLSYFGHITCIFLAYFMLSKLFLDVLSSNLVFVSIVSVIILGSLELIKRSIFDKFSIQFLKFKGLTKEVMPLFIISMIIISMSFYASLKGASEFSSKSEKIEVQGKETIKIYNDSLTKQYTDDISKIENDIRAKDETLSNLQELSLTQKLTRDQRNTISDISKQKKDLELKIKDKKVELSNKISKHEKGIMNDADSKKKDNSKNSLLFIIISIIIELTILAGVYFNEYYKFRSYKEFTDKIEKDPNYQKWFLYDEILNVIYTDDTKINHRLPSSKFIIDMCKANDIIVLPKDIQNFLKILNNINIIKSSGSAKYFNKTKDIAIITLKSHFNIE